MQKLVNQKQIVNQIMKRLMATAIYSSERKEWQIPAKEIRKELSKLDTNNSNDSIFLKVKRKPKFISIKI